MARLWSCIGYRFLVNCRIGLSAAARLPCPCRRATSTSVSFRARLRTLRAGGRLGVSGARCVMLVPSYKEEQWKLA